MADRLPTGVLTLSFEPSAAIPDCLRSARDVARRLQLGVYFEQADGAYLVQPWQSVDQVLEQWDPEQAASILAHQEAHHG